MDNSSTHVKKIFIEDFLSRNLRKVFTRSGNILSKICWRIYVYRFLSWAGSDCRDNEYDLIWARNFEVYQSLAFSKINFILELHIPLNKRQRNFLDVNHENLLIAPISKKICDSINDYVGPSLFSPMAVRESQIASEIEIQMYISNLRGKLVNKQKIELVYVGKLFPGGVSKGVETLIEIAKLAKQREEKITIKIVGGDKEELESFRILLIENKVSEFFLLLGHLNQDSALMELRKSDIVILTKSRDKNYSGFPLKAIEALASGKITVVEKSEVYEAIFNNLTYVRWFETFNMHEIFEGIKSDISDPDLETKLKGNINYSHSFTWENRTRNLVSHQFQTKLPFQGNH